MSTTESRHSGRRHVRARASVLVAVLLLGCRGAPPGPPADDGEGASPATVAPVDPASDASTGAPGVVVKLVDGDTLDVRLDGGAIERLRLIGIDTPETKKPGAPVECFGPEASAHLAELVPVGTAVRVLRDVEARDVYGRFLAYLFEVDGRFVNLVMAQDGYADSLSIPPNTAFSADMARAVADAKAGRRGLWGACPDP